MAELKVGGFRRMRIEADYPNAQSAAAKVGVSLNTWLAWERGDRKCPPEHWESIAKLFAASMEQPWELIYNRLRDLFIPPKTVGKGANGTDRSST